MLWFLKSQGGRDKKVVSGDKFREATFKSSFCQTPGQWYNIYPRELNVRGIVQNIRVNASPLLNTSKGTHPSWALEGMMSVPYDRWERGLETRSYVQKPVLQDHGRYREAQCGVLDKATQESNDKMNFLHQPVVVWFFSPSRHNTSAHACHLQVDNSWSCTKNH